VCEDHHIEHHLGGLASADAPAKETTMSRTHELRRATSFDDESSVLTVLRIGGLLLMSALCIFTIWTVFA
jgi:hypothetical protein